MKTAQSLQLYAGQSSGTEAAVHAINHAFNSDSWQAVLLVNATLNQKVAMPFIGHHFHQHLS